MNRRVRDWLDSLPIGRKLSMFNGMTLLLAGSLSALMMASVIWVVEYRAAEQDALVKASILAENVIAAVQFRDTATASEILSGLARDEGTVSARLLEQDSRVFSEYVARNAVPHSLLGLDLKNIVVAVPVMAGGEALAMLELTVSTREVFEEIFMYLGAIILATWLALAAGSWVVVRLQNLITEPLSLLSSVMKDISTGGDLSRRSKMVETRDELGELSASFNRMLDQIEQNNAALGVELAERKRAEKQLEHLALHDQVTGLPNRHFFRRRAADLTRGRALADSAMALLFVDLDNFKLVNDTFGHDVGDKLLIAVADRLTDTVRANDMVVRFGGDEFVLLLDRVEDAPTADRLANKLLEVLARSFEIDGQRFHVTCSIGVALAPMHSECFEDLLQKADAAMYQAKAAGKNGISLWEQAYSLQASARFALETDLRFALERNELEMHFQPLVALDSGKVVGMEALMRWRRTSGGEYLISPTEFIPVAEDTGLIVEIGDWALRTSFEQVARWNREFGELFVAVNVSMRQLRDRAFPERVDQIATLSGLDRRMCQLEVTESMIMKDAHQAEILLDALSRRGFSLSLDDFGTGYSSLAYLKRFPLNKLKIDRSFVKDLPDDLDDKAIAATIVALSRSLNLDVVAEGIETRAQADVLNSMGCHFGQGYYFSRPLTTESIGKYLRESFAATVS